MIKERVEEYLGAIYRLRADETTPLPLSQLTDYFGFSPVSVHEMIQKLDDGGWLVYHPYRGVTLTETGVAVAEALLRRHRLWERFLTDVLQIEWDDAHIIAGRLEHAATELVTDRLADYLGEPESCPHGAPIPPAGTSTAEQCLASLQVGAEARINRIFPESSALLRYARTVGLVPGSRIKVVEQGDVETAVQIMETSDCVVVPAEEARSIWAGVL